MPVGYGSTFVKQRPLLLGLICLTILYQFVYHNIVVQTFEDSKSEEEAQCEAASLQSTPRCVELRLFQDWQKASPIVGSEVEISLPPHPEAEAARTTPTERLDTERRLEEGGGATDPSTTSWTSMALWAQGLQELQDSVGTPADNQLRTESSADDLPGLSHPVALTRWGQDLQDLQHELEERMTRLPSRNRKSSLTKLATTDGERPNSMIAELEEKLRQLGCPADPAVASKECQELLQAKASVSNDAERPENLEAELEALNGLEDEAHFTARMELLEKEEELKEKLGDLSTQNLAWRTQFADKANSLHKELCESPERRDLPSCVKFLALLEAERQHRAASQATSEEREELTEEAPKAATESNLAPAKQQQQQQQKQQQEGQQKQQKQQKQQQEKQQKQQQETLPSAAKAEGEAVELHWTDVKDWAKARKLRGGKGRSTAPPPALVAPTALQGAHWGGRIPRVACVTAFHSSFSDILSIKAFIDHFHKQTYEGPFDLVFVHHKDDQAAADQLAMHTDGSHVKAVVSLGDANDFPSTTDLRYGAWRAEDADVIAHWPYQDEHPNDRLSLQVRALAYTKRPASILRLPAEFWAQSEQQQQPQQQQQQQEEQQEENGKGSASSSKAEGEGEELAQEEDDEATALEETLLGEAHWMREHWHPLLPEQLAVLQARLERDVAEVDLTV